MAGNKFLAKELHPMQMKGDTQHFEVFVPAFGLTNALTLLRSQWDIFSRFQES